ncbi:hypothetical protein ACH6EH_16025 [Paenibacillus sp. JSM ZJ436]|uniref:hypothetical protein n=1 Tax=Paenibacillus sp. JSM ZJ436 TaxID=3376190 RepID=UPI00379BC2B7
MANKESGSVERIFSMENDFDFESVMKLIVANKIEDLVNNVDKVNTATSQQNEEGFEHS